MAFLHRGALDTDDTTNRVIYPNPMSITEPRPSWLRVPDDLEKRITEGTFTIKLKDLRKSRYDCTVVGHLLNDILPREITLSPSEQHRARLQLALELQRILKKWCEEGLRETLGTMNIHTETGRADFPVMPTIDSVTMGQDLPRHPDVTDLGYPTPLATTSVIPHKRRSEDEMTSTRVKKVYPVGEPITDRDYRCPYNARDPNEHPDCAGRQFPNPRKLKEHIWRFTRPFKCPDCGEGFGRDKTRMIHRDQRKVKCAPLESRYEGSSEERRDIKISKARNTPEIMEVLDEYDRERGGSRKPYGNSHVTSPDSAYSEASTPLDATAMMPAPWSPHEQPTFAGVNNRYIAVPRDLSVDVNPVADSPLNNTSPYPPAANSPISPIGQNSSEAAFPLSTYQQLSFVSGMGDMASPEITVSQHFEPLSGPSGYYPQDLCSFPIPIQDTSEPYDGERRPYQGVQYIRL